MTASKIEIENLFVFIGASYNELSELLINVVSKHALEGVPPGTTCDPNVALHTILSSDLSTLKTIKSTTIEPNRSLLFADNERRRLRPSIDISKMDCSLLLDLLMRFPCLMATNNDAGYMCAHKTNACCQNCNHTPCKKKNCATNCNHSCINCRRLKSECDKFAAMCNDSCKSCLQCSKILFERFFIECKTYLLKGDPVQFKKLIQNYTNLICPSFMIHYCWEIMLDLRNLYAHSNATFYQSFLNGTIPIKIGEIFFRNEGDVKYFLYTVFHLVIKHTTDPSQRKIPFEPEECEKMELAVDSLFKNGDSVTMYVYKNITKIKERSEALQDSIMLSKILEEIHISNRDQTEKILQGVDSANKLQTEEIIERMETIHDDQTNKIEQSVKVFSDDLKKIFVKKHEYSDKFHKNSTKLIGNVGVQVPSIPENKYWEQMINNIYNPSKTGDSIMSWRLSQGACATTQTLKEFEAVGAAYLQRNFLEGYVCFPPREFIEDDVKKQLVEFFEELIKESFVRGKRVVLVSPNISHLSELVNDAFSANEHYGNCDEPSLMVFIEELSLIMVVRIASKLDDIKKQLADCQADVLRLTAIHGHKFKDEEVKITGIIACPSIERIQVKQSLPFQFSNTQEQLYESLFICSEDFQSKAKWWNVCLNELQNRLGQSHKSKSTLMRNLIGEHMASMATVKKGLPSLSSDTAKQLDSVVLNERQLRCILSSSKKQLVKGPFGSGKSLLAQRRLKKILHEMKSSNQKSFIFYMSCDLYSFVDRHVKKSMEDLSDDKVKLICGSMHELYREHVSQSGESRPALDILLKELAVKFLNAHFVCDEMSSTVMTRNVASTINGYLDTILKESYVIFIQQSIMKTREYEEHSLEADHFSEINGMEVHNLKNVMRLTVETQKLLTVAQDVISNKKLKVPIPANTNKYIEQPMVQIETVVTSDGITTSGARSQSLPTSTSPSTSTPDTFAETEEKMRGERIFEDFDSSLKAFSKTDLAKANEHIISTAIDFVHGKSGHGISNKRAKLIYLPEIVNLNDASCIKIFYFILKDLNYHETHPVFIANSLDSGNALNIAVKAYGKETITYFPYLQRRMPNSAEKDKLISTSTQSTALITDHKSFLGMEHEAVVTVVDPKEEISRHSIVEIISRCTSYLTIFALSHQLEREAGTLGEILSAWVDEDLVETIHILLESGDEDSNPIRICEETGDFTVYTQSNSYIKLSEKIQSLMNEKLQLHLSDEQAGNFISEKVSSIASRKNKSSYLIIELEGKRIFREFVYDGKTWSFNDVYSLLLHSNVDEIRSLLDFNPNVINSLRDRWDDRTLLMECCWKHDSGVTALLLKEFGDVIDVMARDANGWTAYHLAAEKGYFDILRRLLKFDASGLDVKKNNGWTPLHLAALNNRRQIVALLLSEGCDVNVRDNRGRSPDQLSDVSREIRSMIKKHRNKPPLSQRLLTRFRSSANN